MLSYIYLASPYTHSDPAVRKQRFRAVCKVAGRLMQQGQALFVPIAMSHPITECTPTLPSKWAFWEQYDREFVLGSKALWVVDIPGWKTSVGVQAEIEIAKLHAIRVRLVNPKTLELTGI